jgi:tRNA(fMet)-specific endonuclease VapC
VRYLLDTDVFTALARGLSAQVVAHAEQAGLEAMAISVVTEGEIRYGLAYKPVPATTLQRIDTWLAQLQRLPLTHKVVEPYAELRASLRKLGQPIGPNDLWIAAHALSEDLTVVTGNTREFSRVPGLRVENWLR